MTARHGIRVFAMVALMLLPGGSSKAEGPDRSAPPSLGAAPSLSLPSIDRFRLSNGLEVHVLTKQQVPLVEIDLLLSTGSAADPEGRHGLASLTAAMLDEGAGGLGALELADAVEYLGAEISTWSTYHFSGVDLFAPVSKLDEALGLMATVALAPEFPESEFERLRLDRLTGLQQARDEPRTLATTLFRRVLFGADHPYGAFSGEKDLRAIQVGDMKAFHERYFKPGSAKLVVVGGVTAEEIRPKLEAHFAGWSAGKAPDVEVKTPIQVEGRRIYLVDKPGAAQSEIRMGRIGVERATEDYFSLEVMNTLLGQSFTSRLNSNLREDKGWAYGAGSRFQYRVESGPFLAASAVQTDVTDKALVEFVKELTNIREMSDEEHLRARNLVALQYPQGFQTISGVAARMSEMVRYDLGENYFNEFVPKALAVTREDAERVAAQYVVPENMFIVVVGDAEKVEKGIRALDLGPMEVLSIDDVLGPAPELQEPGR